MAFAGVGVGKTRLDAPRLDAPRLDDDIGKRSFTGVKASLLVVDDRWRYIDGSIVGLSDGDFIATRRLKGPVMPGEAKLGELFFLVSSCAVTFRQAGVGWTRGLVLAGGRVEGLNSSSELC